MNIKVIAKKGKTSYSNPNDPESYKYIVQTNTGLKISAYASSRCAGQKAKELNRHIKENFKTDSVALLYLEEYRDKGLSAHYQPFKERK